MANTMQGRMWWGNDFDDGTFRQKAEEEYRSVQSQKQELENSTVASTRRSLALVYESEQMGACTAEGLLRQGEQLININRNTTNINKDLKQTRRSINSLKSVFGSIRNKFSKSKSKSEPNNNNETSKGPSPLKVALIRSKRSPATQQFMPQKSLDLDAIYDEDTSGITSCKSSPRRSAQDETEENLELLSGGIERLKGWGLAFQEELSRQDRVITDIGNDVEIANEQLKKQTYDMKYKCK